jgi:small subunit ribosomal protein S1
VKHPAEFTKIGEAIEVVVLELDVENRRLSLGHKQLSDNPWDAYATVFAEGSVHEGEVSQVHDKGATVVFKTEGTEGYVPTRHMVKEDGNSVVKGDVVAFKVIEFSKESRRIVLSHTQVYKEAKSDESAKQSKNTAKNVKKVQSKVEKSTLGDIDALAELKSKMEEEGK